MKGKTIVALGVLTLCGCRRTAGRGSSYIPAAEYRAKSGTVDIYAETRANRLAPAAARSLARVYVPNSKSGSVSVIDPQTYRVVRTFATGKVPQHVVPSYDLSTLWVANNASDSLTPIDPRTGKQGATVEVRIHTIFTSLPTGSTRW